VFGANQINIDDIITENLAKIYKQK